MHDVLGYIHDGYTRRGYISETQRLHPALRFEYRPLLSRERAVIFARMQELDPAEAERLGARTMAAQLAGWNLKDQNGRTVPIEADSIERLEPNLAVKLFDIITGRRVTEIDPRSPGEEQSREVDRSLDRALDAGADDEEMEQEKNLPAG